MIRRRKILDCLSRARLLELAKVFGVAGLSGKAKDAVAAALAAERAIKAPELLAALSRDELKLLCRTAGIDDSGREKQVLIDRLLGEPSAPTAEAPRRRESGGSETDTRETFELAGESPAASSRVARRRRTATPSRGDTSRRPTRNTRTMAKSGKREIGQYEHSDKTRVNNPPVGLVTPATDPDAGEKRKTYQYDPHLDPQLVWAGKAEHTSFEVPTVSLHVHERIDPRSIVDAVRKRNGERAAGREIQRSLFEEPEENPPLRQAVDFYKHAHGWTNRLVAGDSLLVMNSLLEKEGMAGKVQMVYIDPPYGIKYGSNFQPFVNRRDVKDGKDEDLTQEPEMIRAFRDTWELGIHSYLTYLRDRLLLARELLHESGSCFVQIGDDNAHRVREVMDEVFGNENRCADIVFRKTTGKGSQLLDNTYDALIWFAKCKAVVKYRRLFEPRSAADDENLRYVELADGSQRKATMAEVTGLESLPSGARYFRPNPLTNQRPAQGTDVREYEFKGTEYTPGAGTFRTDRNGLDRLKAARRLLGIGKTLAFVRYLDDFPFKPRNDIWDDTRQSGFGDPKRYVVQTGARVIERCTLMTTDPGDLILDPTCGSGTTAVVGEEWGRRWITCDTSRVAVALAKQRLVTSVFDYYELAHEREGIGSGFRYKTVPHVTLKSIANNPEIREGMTRAEIDAAIARYADQETLYDQPLVDKSKVRVTGPFTVEAVPAPAVRPVDVIVYEPRDVTAEAAPVLPGIGPLDGQERLSFREEVAVARSGETLRQAEWRDELVKCGIRGRSGQRIEFARLEPLGGTRYLQCAGETKGDRVERVVVSFGPEHAPLEQRQVEQALEEATRLKPTPALVVFATFQFDPEAAKDIDETNWPGVTLVKAQMNTDLLTDDLKKKRSSNESYWLVGQPDVELRQVAKGEHKGQWQVEVRGFDYYNPRSGQVESGDTAKIAMWLLDTDYDGRSLFPRQVFFPMAGEKDGWARLAKNLKAEIDEERIEAYRGTESLPFAAGENRRVAVKIVDDRGIESLKVLAIE